ncbi:MAG: hypothetical protein C0459_02575 [Chitinophaga sp.]|jgi:tetratricopeptide (TPR) repeat protein|nr:hypothetical protein [Chitinophaga sp.]
MRTIISLCFLLIITNVFGQVNCDSLFNLADKSYEEKGAKEAITFFTKIITLKCPNLSLAYNNRGFMFNEIEDYKSAIADFENAIKFDSLNHEAYANESTSYNMLDNSLMATILINKAIKLDTNNYQYYKLRGDIKYSEEKFDSAIINYKKSISLKRDYLQLYTLIARIYEEKNRTAIKEANNIDSSIKKDFNQLTFASSFYRNRDSAEAILTLLVERFPQNKLLIFNRAEFYRRNFLYDKAIPDYLQGLNDNKEKNKKEESLSNLANCYDGIGDYNNAIKYYTESIRVKPNVIAFANRGRRYKKLNNFKQAISDEENAIKLDSTYAQAYLIIGNCYLEMKQRKKALEYFKKGLAQNPKGEIKDLLEMQLSKVE